MQQLIDHAATLECRVVFLPLEHYDGIVAAPHEIVVNSRLHGDFQREVLAHELGHVWHGHDWRRRHDRERDERQADEYAATLLITPEEYARAERDHGPHLGALAQALRVSTQMIEAWRRVAARKIGIRFPTGALGRPLPAPRGHAVYQCAGMP